jgi:hypothetical protein
MNRFVLSAAGAALIALTITSCGSGSTGSSTASKPSGGSSATVITPSPTPTAAPSVQPFNVGGYLAGNAKPTFPAGEPGQVFIVAQGPLKKPGIGAVLPVAYRNNTGAAISHVDLSATARLNGKLVASGKSQGATPAQVQPGEVGFAFIYFEDSKSMAETRLKYEFTAETSPADTSSFNTAPLTVGEVTYNGSSIVGTAVNKTGKALSGPYDVQVYCFAGKKLTAEVGSFAEQNNDVAAAAKVSFTADLSDTKCAKFTVGVSGYFK